RRDFFAEATTRAAVSSEHDLNRYGVTVSAARSVCDPSGRRTNVALTAYDPHGLTHSAEVRRVRQMSRRGMPRSKHAVNVHQRPSAVGHSALVSSSVDARSES